MTATYSTIRSVQLFNEQKLMGKPRLLLACFSALGTVLRASLLTVLDALGIQSTANHVVTHTRQVFHTAAAQQHDTVFLQVVAFAADVRNDFETVGQANLGDL